MSTPARERSAFGQFQLGRSGIGVGVDYTKVKKLSTADMAEMLRDGVTKAEVCEAFGLSKSAVNTRLMDAGWSPRDGQSLTGQLDPKIVSPDTDSVSEHPAFGVFAFTAQPWVDDALCAQTDPEVFFPEKGGSTREAKAVCGGCFVAAECLDYALTMGERFGIWGGVSERERRKLQGDTRPPKTVPCTTAGCDRFFSTERSRDRHIREGHGPPRTLLTCSQCGRIFTIADHLRSHARAAHPSTERTPPMPTITVLLIPADPDQPITWSDVDRGLASFQHLVGGQVQVVPLNVPGCDLWCNEDATGLDLAVNARATTLYYGAGGMPGFDVLGDTFITGGTDDEGETLGVTFAQAQLLLPEAVPS